MREPRNPGRSPDSTRSGTLTQLHVGAPVRPVRLLLHRRQAHCFCCHRGSSVARYRSLPAEPIADIGIVSDGPSNVRFTSPAHTRSRGRHDEENPQRELRLRKASSARGDQDQQASVLEAALRRGRQRRLGQTIQGCHVAPRMPAGQAAQLPSPSARPVAALFPRVPSGPALRLPRRVEEPIPAVTLEELKGAQSRIKERSAPGPDGIPNSALKIAIAARPDIFLPVYTTCLETGVFPPVWKRQRLVLIPKPGKPPDEPSSYRPLCMLDTAGKILERIVCDRLKAFTERPGGLSERQYGFRKGRSTIDAIEDIVSRPPGMQ
ncbi:unnamed protein product [Trichogramma brassicae]|uniref:Uncharacterized protein n=1 Tax=Trichogramma brassicae TaxID=86971 RepID=A0A6H5HWU9_9HYME|nr:unnamed protein product [Trichogramma brassicae]